ncbi:hypothetical protein [Deefgea sp. CFH1-16]|uniref:hypothetical protein n=1 Tax=Deefgea sp. CFH1-16 TaxID=2675457 RepID=UPI0019402380|nr:hypothetical protein [Deefgea sp. CFH1-16]
MFEIMDQMQQLLLDQTARQQMSAAGVQFANAHRGATAKLVRELRDLSLGFGK